MTEKIKVVSVLPDLLGTYGDSGNAIVASRRLALRGYEPELVTAVLGEAVPADGDFYLIGGGEDGPQAKAAQLLNADAALEAALDRGAALLAVCAGFQILGESFIGPDMNPTTGIGVFACKTHRFDGPRSVGELVTAPTPGIDGVPELTGYENHQGVTELLEGTIPLGMVLVGKGNNCGKRIDGAVSGKAIGTYMHGPVLARNPALCDYFLSLVVGKLEPLEDVRLERAHAKLYEERIKEAYKLR